ncbi:MAG: 3-oxoacyl-ACP synthase [Bacteroidetes bacterium]|nr:MAG: 3-oxoacyl-ACP synthase [Bacteroidota bacterium]
MAVFAVHHVRMAGISSCVPSRKEYNRDYDWISEDERRMLIKTTGIDGRHVADKGVATSDLCLDAAELLLKKLGWKKDEIDLLVFVSQSRDYILPSTAIILQDRLGLPKTCAAFDIGLGCSGYVYGLSAISSMIATGGFRKALLMAGDISTLSLNYKDKSTYPLFGDAGTVTALEYDPSAPAMYFNLQSDGSGYQAIILPDGGVRQRPDENTYVESEVDKGIIRSRGNLWLNGLDVFNFSVREAPPNISALIQYCQADTGSFDYFVFHQANLLMNETIRKKLKIPAEKVPYSLGQFGNTSSASIPLTINTLKPEQVSGKKRWLLSGFGVGLSWGTASVETENLVCTEIIYK